MMGPEPGSEKYAEQIKIIKMRLDDVADLIPQDSTVLPRVLSMFIMDTEYSRAAICQAEHEWKREQEAKP